MRSGALLHDVWKHKPASPENGLSKETQIIEKHNAPSKSFQFEISESDLLVIIAGCLIVLIILNLISLGKQAKILSLLKRRLMT